VSATILKFPKLIGQPAEDEYEARKHALTAAAFRLMRMALADDLTIETAISFGDVPNGS
jgi:hypothetical protein